MVPLVLTTPRLRLRAHDLTDLSYMVALSADPEVVRYTGDGPLRDEDEARECVLRLQPQHLQRLGRLVVLDAQTEERLGWCGLKWLEDAQEFDLGYRFFRRHWGKGYATEAARACLDFGFLELALEQVIALVVLENVRSVRVVEKVGFRRTGTVTSDGLTAERFVLGRTTPG